VGLPALELPIHAPILRTESTYRTTPKSAAGAPYQHIGRSPRSFSNDTQSRLSESLTVARNLARVGSNYLAFLERSTSAHERGQKIPREPVVIGIEPQISEAIRRTGPPVSIK
jgi:hypothetical protein